MFLTSTADKASEEGPVAEGGGGVRADASGRDPGRAEEEQSGTGEQRRRQRQRALMGLVSNLSVPDLGVSDHKAIPMELPTLSPLNKPNRRIIFRNL